MVFSVFNAKGGVGKTMIAFNLAYKFSQYDKTLLLDSDPQGSVRVWQSYRKSELPFEILSSNDIKTLRVAPLYRFIVIDIGGYDSEQNKEFLLSADVAIIPMNLCPLAISVYNSISYLLENQNLKAFCVLNRMPTNPKLKAELDSIKSHIAKKQDNITLLDSMIYDRIGFTQSIARGESIYESKNTKAIQDFDKFYLELISKIV